MEPISVQIEKYLEYCEKKKKLSVNTLRAYRIDVDYFLTFLSENSLINEAAEKIGKETIQLFVNKLIENYAPRTCKRKIACIKAFFNYLEFTDVILVNPFRKVHLAIKENVVLPKVIKCSDVKLQLAYIYKSLQDARTERQLFYAWRMVAVYELLLSTGIRIGELCHMNISSIDFDNKSIRIIGKGGKERTIYLVSDTVIRALESYLHRRSSNSDYLFINWNKHRMSEDSIRKEILSIGRKVVHRRITPHMFRHTFATMLLERNVNINYIQELLGHSSVKTTQIYLHVANFALRTALENANLRERMVF